MAWRRGGARRGRTRGLRAARPGRTVSGPARPRRGARPLALRPLLAVALIAAAVALSVTGPARIGAALRDAAAQWWAMAWSEVKGEGARVLPAMRARLQDDPDLARTWLEQGLPSPAARDGAAPSGREEWEQELRRLLTRVAGHDVDDPKALVARHLAGGTAPGAPPAPPEPVAASS